MAQDVLFLSNDNLTRKKWARDLFRILLPATEFNDLTGTSTDSVIQLKTDLAKGEGDTLTFGIRLPLTGEGIVGSATVEGNEEKLRFKDFKVTIEELNHAVDTGGKMEEQRVPYNLMVEARDGLSYWWAEKLSNYAFAVLCGDSGFRIAGQVFAQAISEPDTAHFIMMNDTAETSQTAADMADLSLLDRMKQRAELPTTAGAYKVRPLKIGGKNYFRVILHTYVFDRMRQNMNAGQWGDVLRSGQKLQLPNVEFEYNGMIVSKSQRIRPSAYNASVYRNVLLGAQAAVFAWGGAGESKSTTMAFVPYEKDAKRYVMVRGGGIFGMTKTIFDSKDFGIIVGSSYATALT